MNASALLQGVPKPVSQLAMGTAHFSSDNGDLWLELLDGFRDGGGTVIDTARLYGDSEDIIGRWLSSRGSRDGMVVCTKGGHGDNLLPAEGMEDTLEKELLESLEHLQTSHIDMYWLHRDNQEIPVARILDRLNTFCARGLIGAFGGSNWRYSRVRAANSYAEENGLTGFAGVSNNLSLAAQTEPFYPGLLSCGVDGVQWHIDSGLPLFSWSSQARGFFVEGIGSNLRNLSAQTTDGHLRRMAEVYGTEDNFERLRRAESLGKDKGRTAVQIALSWLIHHPANVVPIVGPRDASELDSCLDALSISLTEAECKWLDLEADSANG